MSPLFRSMISPFGWRTALNALTVLFFAAASAGAYTPGAQHPALTPGAVPGPPLTAAQLTDIGSRIRDAMVPAPVPTLAKTSMSSSGPVRSGSGSNGTPAFLDHAALSLLSTGASKKVAQWSPADRALAFLADNRNVFRIDDPSLELTLAEDIRDPGGRAHLRFDQSWRGVTVWGSGLVVHLDADGNPYAFNGRYLPTPSGLDTGDVRVGGEAACAKAFTEFAEFSGIVAGELPRSVRLVIWTDRDLREARLAWLVTLGQETAPVRRCFVDAVEGGVLEAFDCRPTGTPATATARDYFGQSCTLHVTKETDKYTLSDSEALIQIFDVTGKILGRGDAPVLGFSKNNVWSDSLLVSAMNNARKTCEYYRDVHGRASLLGGKTTLIMLIHYSSDGNPAKAAFWAGGYAAFGDAIPYASAQDIVAHELTHGVVEKTVGLVYSYQSGALNEGFADFFGAMVDPDWEIGEDLPGGAIRDISNPGRFGNPADMTGYQDVPLRTDNGGVHLNMTIPTRAGYLVSEVIGREKAAKIWYSILANRYLSPRAVFTDLRLAALQAATDLYGANSTEVRAVELAFDQVGIVGETWTKPPEDHAAREGERWFLFMNDFTDRHLFAAREDKPGLVIPVTSHKVFYGSASPFSVAENGSMIAYIDEGNNLRTFNLDTGKDASADSSGLWYSVEINADGTRLAATRTTFDRTIYIIDLKNPSAGKAITVYTAGTEGSATSTARYVDAMDWDSTGTKLLFDAYHRIEVEGGDPIEFWDINQVDIESGIITRIKTPSEQGLQAGNPSYAETNDRYIVCDLVSFEQHINAVAVFDLYTLGLTRLRDNAWSDPYPVIGHPKFSPDDRSIIFQQDDIYYVHAELYSLPVNATRTAVEGEAFHLTAGGFPRWFVRVIPPVGIKESASPNPGVFTLGPNHPNPFNAETVIPYTLHAPGTMCLTLHDILGRRVAVLEEGFRSAGSYSTVFRAGGLASGVYFLRMEVDGRTASGRMLLIK